MFGSESEAQQFGNQKEKLWTINILNLFLTYLHKKFNNLNEINKKT